MGIITRVSENLLLRVGADSDDVLGCAHEDAPVELRELFRQCFALKVRDQSASVRLGNNQMVARQVSADKHLLVDLELEADLASGLASASLKGEASLDRVEILYDVIRSFSKPADIKEVCDHLVVALRKLSTYDRVMVYRFDYDKTGIVVSEAKSDELEPFMGLRYPASDIPAQARHLFTLNFCRVIQDVESLPSPILSSSNLRPLDLSYSALRSVSPVHIEYLVNMGVRASATFSIIVNGELWGLVACHQYGEPKSLSPSFRRNCEVLISVANLAISSIENISEFRMEAVREETIKKFFSVVTSPVTLESAFSQYWPELCAMNGSHGMTMLHGSEVHSWGKTPGIEFNRSLGYWLDRKMDSEELFYIDSLPTCWKAAEAQKETACGILALRIPVVTGGISTRAFIIWFRPELVSTVSWGRNPEKAAIATDSGIRLFPRSSFEKWMEEVRLKSERWTEGEIKAAKKFRAEYIGYCILQQEDLIRENLRMNFLQQGKLEIAVRLLYEIRNIASTIHAKIACNQLSLPWDEIIKLTQLKDLFIRNLDALDIVLGEGKGTALQSFIESLVQSLQDRENEVINDFSFLTKLVREVDNILGIQRNFSNFGAERRVNELVLAELVQQAVRLTSEADHGGKVRFTIQIQHGILVKADEGKLIRVLMNCIDMCVESIRKAGTDSGDISISAVVRPGSARMSRYEVLLRITDNGAGLAGDVQREIDMTSEGEAQPTSSLAHKILSCRDIIRSSGGTLSFEALSDGRVCIQTISMPCALEIEGIEGCDDSIRQVV
jgi:light-regulated signal transduction histidine kinase (bacteriophytochrome)